MTTTSKKIILGITGGIAAYKSADLVRRIREQGAEVKVVMTQSAQAFITPLTLQALSGNRVHTSLLSEEAEAAMGHIELARWADYILVAPASANFIARLANGMADDLLATLCLASEAPIAIAPAMNQQMWHHVATQENVETLKSRNVTIFGPGEGSQACGETGLGRMLEPLELVDLLAQQLQKKILQGKKIVITAGPTRERLDPVRYLTSYSSGKMGYALAAAAKQLGAEVVLVSGPTHLTAPNGVKDIQVESAQAMYKAVMAVVSDADIFVSAAAVADYRPKVVAANKIKKSNEDMSIALTRNPDIIAEVAKLKNKPVVVGFAAETENVIANAKIKMHKKGLDIIIANQVGNGVGFASDNNQVTIIGCGSEPIELPSMEKVKLANKILSYLSRTPNVLNPTSIT